MVRHQALTLASDLHSVREVEILLQQLIEEYQISHDKYSDMLISLTEAVTNAIRHGNRLDKRKYVRISFKVEEGEIRFRVMDEGEGFDFENLPDPTAPENLVRCGGRGVFLMKQLSDRMSFKNNGSTVEMCFKTA